MKILIAEDNQVDRMILAKALEFEGHQVVEAETGQQALDLYLCEQPELVFLDVLMPELDGYQVAQAIKDEAAGSWVPIIFLTSLTDVYDLAKCIESGGDDFVTKPINRILINAKIAAFSRIAKLYETVEAQKNQIAYHNQHLINEQEAAKKTFDKIAHLGCLDAPNISYLLSPKSIFNGDLVLAAETPKGGQRMMLADFTGHGLPAAIGAIPAAEIFYSMTGKGFAISDVVTEMNRRLHSILPRGLFCCLVIADIDVWDQRITLWNGGAPQAYLIDSESGKVSYIQSVHLPLGVMPPKDFKVSLAVRRFSPNHRLLAVTDGMIEAVNPDNKMY